MKWSDLQRGDVVANTIEGHQWEVIGIDDTHIKWRCIVPPSDPRHFNLNVGTETTSWLSDAEIHGDWRLDDSFQHWVNKVCREEGIV